MNIKRALKRFIPNKLLPFLGVISNIDCENRRFLENDIFKYFNQSYGCSADALFIGVAPYTWHYSRLLDANIHSIDINPAAAIFGVKNKTHVTGSVLRLSDYYPHDNFDFVIANGVVGFGVNDLVAFELMLNEIGAVLKKNGLLLLGYNNTDAHLKFDINTYESSIFNQFSPSIVGFDRDVYVCDDEFDHEFRFFIKK